MSAHASACMPERLVSGKQAGKETPMRRLTNHTKTGLFLMEMILCLLFLGLACAICLRLFASAYLLREEARTNNHVEEILITSCELLESWDGDPASYSAGLVKAGLLPEEAKPEKNRIRAAFDRKWTPCPLSEGYYFLNAALSHGSYLNHLALSLQKSEDKDNLQELYHYEVDMPAAR